MVKNEDFVQIDEKTSIFIDLFVYICYNKYREGLYKNSKMGVNSMEEPRYVAVVQKGEESLVTIEKVGEQREDLSSNKNTVKLATDSLDLAVCFAEYATNRF